MQFNLKYRDMKISKLLIVIAVAIMTSYCSQVEVDEGSITANAIGNIEQECLNVDLLAGQNTDAGDLTITEINGDYTIRYETTDGWELDAVHLYIGDCDEIPTTGAGNPKIGKFPIKETFSDGTTVFTYVLEASDIPFCGCIAAHAEVSKNGKNETAWAQGMNFSGNSWAMFLEFCGCSF